MSNGKGVCFPKLVAGRLAMPFFPSLLLYVLIVCRPGGEKKDVEDRAGWHALKARMGGEADCCLFASPSKYVFIHYWYCEGKESGDNGQPRHSPMITRRSARYKINSTG